MQRREVVRFLGAALALPFIPSSAEKAIDLAANAHRRLSDGWYRTLNGDQQRLVSAIAEMIIPETDTPGATKMRVPEFIDLILTEWASDDEKAAFLAGLTDIDTRAATLGAAHFVDLPPTQKVALLSTLDTVRTDKSGAGLAFGKLKALTVYGYFTSQYVEQEILKTQMFFNGYNGNVPFTPRV